MGSNVIRLAESHIHPFAEGDLQEPGEDGPRTWDLGAMFSCWGVGGYRRRSNFKTAIYFHYGDL